MPEDCYKLDHVNQVRIAIWTFINITRWKPCVGGENGSSWIELMAAFQIMGGCCETKANNVENFDITQKFRSQFDFFVRTFKQVSSMFVSLEDQALFRPAKNKEHRLKNYGVDNHVPYISAVLCMSEVHKVKMHIALALCACNLNIKQTKDLQNGNIRCIPKKLTMRGAVPWNERFQPDATKPLILWAEKSRMEKSQLGTTEVRLRPAMFHLFCRVCREPTD